MKKFLLYIGANLFKIIVAFALICCLVSDLLQTMAILASNVELNNFKNETIKLIEDKEANNKIVADTINARIDTLDGAIDPDLKRRELLKIVRDAINENTTKNIDIRTLNNIGNAIIDYSYEFNLPIAMVMAQIKQESDFNPQAESHAECKGLMQILDSKLTSTARDIAGDLGYRTFNIWDVKTNIRFGSYYMSQMLVEYNNNYEDALRAYNFGPHFVAEVKSGIRDYSRSKVVLENGIEIKYLVDKYGNFELDELGQKIKVVEEHMYPRETIDYVKRVKANREIFAKYGLDRVE